MQNLSLYLECNLRLLREIFSLMTLGDFPVKRLLGGTFIAPKKPRLSTPLSLSQVVELRTELDARHLNCKGLRTQLVARLTKVCRWRDQALLFSYRNE